jgi:hypothetical protein
VRGKTMRRLLCALLFLGYASLCTASEPNGGAEVYVTPAAASFGTIERGKVIEGEFAIVNAGSTQSELTNIKNSCGCTKVTWKPCTIKGGEAANASYAIDTAKV